MPRPASKHPTERELEILKILWRDGPLTGREVRDRLATGRDPAYTSVMTIMGIMEEKGYLRRRKAGKNFVYSARVTEAPTKRRMLLDLIERAFAGSKMAAVVNLLDTTEIDPDEIKQLRALLRRKLQQGGEP